jgi:hypothetical protein
MAIRPSECSNEKHGILILAYMTVCTYPNDTNVHAMVRMYVYHNKYVCRRYHNDGNLVKNFIM